jgi:type I restriction enzyme, S subunit
MNRYSKYKPSGINWIVEIPSHWEETKLKYIGYLYAGLTGKSGEDFKQTDNPQNKPFIPFTNIANNLKINPNQLDKVVMSEDDEQNKVVKNDLFFMMSSENFDDVGKATILLNDLGECYLNSFCKGFRVIDKNVHSPYLNYLLLNDAYRRRLMIEANGFTRINLKMEKVNDFEISLPPLEEQTTIANFLDDKTTQIDKLISNKQKLIELLKEERIAIINEAVSGKGKNWERKKLKYVAKVQSSNVDKKTNEGETPILLCNYMDVYKNEFIDDSISFMEATASEKEIEKFILREGDVLITKDSETPDDIANSSFVTKDFENVICGYHLAQIRANKKKLIGEFLFRLFQSKDFNTHFEVSAHGVTRYGLPLDSITDVFIPLPPVAEQKEIAKHIFIESKRIDETVSKIEKEIELMNEYKTALISEVVTGKVKVIDN